MRDTSRNAIAAPGFGVRLLRSLGLLLALAVAATGAWAQEDEMPGRVGRVADIGGAVFVAPADRASEWVPAEINYPVATGDNLWVSGEGRAEIDFGGGQFRLAGDTNVNVSRLSEREFALFVAQGRLIVRVRALDAGDVAQVDTPNTQVQITRPGLYRIDVSEDRQETTVVVREGEVYAVVAGGLQQVLPGQTATLFGQGDVQADVRNGAGIDGFDSWSANRDRVYLRSTSTNYVSRQMVGYADLDANGSWQTYPDYGAVWFPSAVADDWAPYRYGRWVSVPAWGWTWVDDAPWGYAPFHYGRWAHIGGRWGWCPGAYVARPVWAPALVAWYGGGGWAAGGGGPVYGWVPLGWRDPYVPSWRNCGSRCWTAYNRPYAVNVAERPRQPPAQYANRNVPGAITAVGGAAFAGGRPVRSNLVNLPPQALASASPMLAAPQVKPLPVTANTLRPGNGVPPPASQIQARTKPLVVSPSPSGGTAPPWSGGDGRRPSVPQAGPSAGTPPMAVRPAPPPPTAATTAVPGAPNMGRPPAVNADAIRTPPAPSAQPGVNAVGPAPNANGYRPRPTPSATTAVGPNPGQAANAPAYPLQPGADGRLQSLPQPTVRQPPAQGIPMPQSMQPAPAPRPVPQVAPAPRPVPQAAPAVPGQPGPAPIRVAPVPPVNAGPPVPPGPQPPPPPRVEKPVPAQKVPVPAT